MLFKLERDGKIHGIKIGRTGLAISHLFFADDIFLFCRANSEEVNEIKNCLNLYCKWSGQRINYAKSGRLFSKNTSAKVRMSIKALFGLSDILEDARYLGNPLFGNRKHSKDYEELKIKIEAKLQVWKSKLLSQAGKYTLIKSVVTALPLYAMSAAKLHSLWCKNIENLAIKFLWDRGRNDRTFIPISWSRVCQPKEAGGLGLRRGLSTFGNLLNCNVLVSDKDCIHGCGCIESDNHLFFHCQVAKALWFVLPWSIKWDDFEDSSIEEKLQLFVNPTAYLPVHLVDKEDFFLYASLLLAQLWKIINLTKHENKVFNLDNTVNLLRVRLAELKASISKENSETHVVSVRRGSWRKPPTYFIKINSNAAVKDGFSTISAIARDHRGKVLKIKVSRLQTDLVELAEAYGILHGLYLAKEEGWKQVCLESDARNVIVNILNQDLHSTHCLAAGVISEIHHLNAHFQDVLFSWVPREANFLAHSIGGWCHHNNCCGFLCLDALPSNFFCFAAQEMSLLDISHS
nr:uncharacterized protein LOC125418466 [Ziziphus jujuba var. spinosa]